MPKWPEMLFMLGTGVLVLVVVAKYEGNAAAARDSGAAANAQAVGSLLPWLTSSGSPDIGQGANYWTLFTLGRPPAGAGAVNQTVAAAHGVSYGA